MFGIGGSKDPDSSATFTLDATQGDLRFVKEENFLQGCTLLRACSAGDMAKAKAIIDTMPLMCTFKDYDGRTALHVAASEGHLELVKYLLERGAGLNRSDRWGGSPLDDALRHRHGDVAEFLRASGCQPGVFDRTAALVRAANSGDADEVYSMLQDGADINSRDIDKRSPLHIACSRGHTNVVQVLTEAGALLDTEDRWGQRPIDDARRKGHPECEAVLVAAGATPARSRLMDRAAAAAPASATLSTAGLPSDRVDTLEVEWDDVVAVEKIGAGAFGEIWKCRWRGTLVAAKMLKPKEGSKHAGTFFSPMKASLAREHHADGSPTAMRAQVQVDPSRMAALADLKQEIGLLGQLRHPNICLFIGYSLVDGREIMLSELMKCSLLDVLKTFGASPSPMPRARALRYGIQFAQGMNYLHTCKPPILHRDLKPANLLLDFSDTLKVADFGLAKLRPFSGESFSADEYQPYVMTGETGSYRFMAPEVYRHQPYGRPVDVYSFAMIMYYLLSNEPPWGWLGGLEAVDAAATKKERPRIPRGWDQRLSELIRQSWDDEPKVRPSFAGVLEQLNEVFEKAVGSSYEESIKRAPAGGEGGGSGCCVLQ